MLKTLSFWLWSSPWIKTNSFWGLQRVNRCVGRARKIRHLGGCKSSPLRRRPTEVDFPYPGYPRRGTALALQLQCLEMPPVPPPQQMSIGKGVLPPQLHWGRSAWHSLLPPGVKSMPAFDPRVALHFLQECRQNLEKSLQQMPQCTNGCLSSCQPQQGKPQEPYFASSWAQGISGQASLVELYSSPKMGINM